ncbi:MAG: zinc-dependent peptidase [Gammaproteobacteria bacterium]|nr:MAG: zinc-dependent peptidase [Gammaproteobacteria bacterium]
MLRRLWRWREDRALARLHLEEHWDAIAASWPPAARYRGAARARLRDTALRFLLRKQFVPGADLELNDRMRMLVATMAAVPVLGLDLDWYRGWSSVVIYETAFVPDGEWEDEFGIVHAAHEPLSGEAWPQGPVILSWADILAAGGQEGYNVVIHEMAHKLDMLADGPNGAPPLHRDMSPAHWRRTFTAAWDRLHQAAEQNRPLPVDPYALEDSGEFFAVLSECFFEAPERLATSLPEVFAQLSAFYRQDPRSGSLRSVGTF